MPFTEIQRDLEIVILNKVSQTEREISYDITFSQNLTALLAPHGPKTPGVLGFGGQSPQG